MENITGADAFVSLFTSPWLLFALIWQAVTPVHCFPLYADQFIVIYSQRGGTTDGKSNRSGWCMKKNVVDFYI